MTFVRDFGVNVCFRASNHDSLLSRRIQLFPAYYDDRLRGVSWPVNHFFAVRLRELDATIKRKEFHFIGIYEPSGFRESIRLDEIGTDSLSS